MSISEEIRKAMRTAGDAMTGREICDALGCDDREERDRVYKTLAAMVSKRTGIEQQDDKRYALIPGWTPSRALPKPLKSKAKADVPFIGADPGIEVGGTRHGRARDHIGTITPPADPHQVRVVGLDVQADRVEVVTLTADESAALSWPFETIMLPRRTVRTLVAAIFTHADKLTEDQRQAVIDAAREAA